MIPTDRTYCLALLESDDPDRFYAVRYAPAAARDVQIALGAWRVEQRRIPKAVSEPGLGEIRLQWWRDAWDEIATALQMTAGHSQEKKHEEISRSVRAHPVVRALALALAASPTTDPTESWGRAIATGLDAAAEARAQLFYEPRFHRADRFLNWALAAERPFDKIFALISDQQSRPDIVIDAQPEADLIGLCVTATLGPVMIPASDQPALADLIGKRFGPLRRRLREAEPEQLAHILPAALLPHRLTRLREATNAPPRDPVLRRHLVFARAFLTGQL